MIVGIINQKPLISFGEDKVHLDIVAGEPVTIWLKSLFNTDYYTFIVNGISVEKISAYEWKVIDKLTGNFTIQMEVIIGKEKVLKSNILTLSIK